ncbi:hypothetical protein HDU76_011846, partial [Blyttiomyces sp. JEL0837]
MISFSAEQQRRLLELLLKSVNGNSVADEEVAPKTEIVKPTESFPSQQLLINVMSFFLRRTTPSVNASRINAPSTSSVAVAGSDASWSLRSGNSSQSGELNEQSEIARITKELSESNAEIQSLQQLVAELQDRLDKAQAGSVDTQTAANINSVPRVPVAVQHAYSRDKVLIDITETCPLASFTKI